MLTLTKRKEAFIKLGTFLGQITDEFSNSIAAAEIQNAWFTQENILLALKSWQSALTEENVNTWLNAYDFSDVNPKTVAVITAGNIPLVGFHDFLSVLICGHQIIVRQSSKDNVLLSYLANYIESVEPGFKGKITFTEGKLENFDAVIATGSNNTSRYFEYYFKGKPNIIRHNRNSVAVLTGNESQEQLQQLSDDIFSYFGLGCRNVSKMFVPENYDFNVFFNAIYHKNSIINKIKYSNNYDYNKAVYLMSEFNILDNGFFMLKEDSDYSSPISVCFYEYYKDKDSLKEKLQTEQSQIQCVVSDGFIENEVPFGQTQYPQLWDYADDIDTVNFLLKI